jgi:hypothetical protein
MLHRNSCNTHTHNWFYTIVIHSTYDEKLIKFSNAGNTIIKYYSKNKETIKIGVIWDVTPCGSCKNRRFGGTWRLLHQGDKMLVAACVVPSSPILVTVIKEAPGSSVTSVQKRATRRNITEDTFLHSHRRENLKSYKEAIDPSNEVGLEVNVRKLSICWCIVTKAKIGI